MQQHVHDHTNTDEGGSCHFTCCSDAVESNKSVETCGGSGQCPTKAKWEKSTVSNFNSFILNVSAWGREHYFYLQWWNLTKYIHIGTYVLFGYICSSYPFSATIYYVFETNIILTPWHQSVHACASTDLDFYNSLACTRIYEILKERALKYINCKKICVDTKDTFWFLLKCCSCGAFSYGLLLLPK